MPVSVYIIYNQSTFLGTLRSEKHWIPRYYVICLIVNDRNSRVIITLQAKQNQNAIVTPFSIPK